MTNASSFIVIEKTYMVPVENEKNIGLLTNLPVRRDELEFEEQIVSFYVCREGYVIKCKSQLFMARSEQLIMVRPGQIIRNGREYSDEYNLVPPFINIHNIISIVYDNKKQAIHHAEQYLETKDYEIVKLHPYGSEEREKQMFGLMMEFVAYVKAAKSNYID
jgi:hypothetical protein